MLTEQLESLESLDAFRAAAVAWARDDLQSLLARKGHERLARDDVAATPPVSAGPRWVASRGLPCPPFRSWGSWETRAQGRLDLTAPAAPCLQSPSK